MKKHRTGGWAGLMVLFGFMAGFWALAMIVGLMEAWDSAVFIVGAVAAIHGRRIRYTGGSKGSVAAGM